MKPLHLQETKTGSAVRHFESPAIKAGIQEYFSLHFYYKQDFPNPDFFECNFPNVINRSSHVRLRNLKCVSAGWHKYYQRGTVYTNIFGVVRCHMKCDNSELKGVKV